MSTFRTSDCSNRCSECAPGFTGLDALREKARYIPNPAKVGGGEVGGLVVASGCVLIVVSSHTGLSIRLRPWQLSMGYN